MLPSCGLGLNPIHQNPKETITKENRKDKPVMEAYAQHRGTTLISSTQLVHVAYVTIMEFHKLSLATNAFKL